MMFTEKETDAYKSITAPDSLRNRITAKKRTTFAAVRSFAVLAACFIFIISALFIGKGGNNILINGQELKGDVEFYVTSSTLGRSASSVISVPVEIKTSKETTVVVEDGLLRIDGKSPAKTAEISSYTVIWWELEPESEKDSFEMKISDKNSVQKIVLNYENSKIKVTKEKEK